MLHFIKLIIIYTVFSAVSYGQVWRWYPVANFNDLFLNGVVVTKLLNGQDSILIAGSDIGGIFRSSNLGKSWARTNITNLWIKSFSREPVQNIMYAGTFGNGILRSTDGGKLWGSVNNGISDNFIYSILALPGTATVFAGATGKLFRSEDYGQTWSTITLDVSARINALINSEDNNILYAGLENNGLYMSTDRGRTWASTINPMRGLSLVSFVRLPGENYFAGTKAGLYRYLTENPNWVLCSNGLPSTSSWGLVQNTRGMIFACYATGVWGSSDYGSSWLSANVGLEDLNVNTIVVAGDKDFLFAGTQGGFVFRSEGTLTNVQNEIKQSSTSSAVYPNPSSGLVSFKLKALQFDHLSITVYSVTGQSVYRTQAEVPGAGTHTITLNLPKTTASGVYCLQIAGEAHSLTLPFTFINTK